MMDSGRRIGMALSHVMCTKLPGRAWAAHLDAATRSTNCFASWACCEMTRALSRKMVPRTLGVIAGPSRPTGARGEHFRQHRHAHRDAVADLVADHRLRSVGHVGGDLDAAVHRLGMRSEEHTSELQSRSDLVCRLLLEKKKNKAHINISRSEL